MLVISLKALQSRYTLESWLFIKKIKEKKGERRNQRIPLPHH